MHRQPSARIEPPEALVVEVVRGRDADLAVADDPEAERRVLDERRLVHLRGGEAGEAGALGEDDGLGLVGLGGRDRALRRLERVDHARTPT